MRISLRGRRRAWLAVPVVLVVAAGSGGWLMTRDSPAAAQATTATVSTSTMQETVAASGTVEPARSADLDFEVSGTVSHVYVAAGDRVKKGQALARVDADALVASRTAAEATLTAAGAQLADDQDADASDTQLAADQASILSARASLDEAEEAVEDATLRSTITGTVVALDLAKGDVVGTSSGGGGAASTGATTGSATTSTSAVTVQSTGHYVVSATVSSTDVARLKEGLQATITPTGVADPVYGTVASVGLVAQTSSSGAAVFPVTIAVTGTRTDLYAGTSADASIVVKQVDDVLTVPSRALKTSGATTYVLEVVGDRSVRTTVTTGATYGMSTEVTRGLQDGDVVEIPGFTRPSGGGGSGNQQGELPDFDDQQPPGGFPAGGQGGPQLQQGGGQ
ncbi:efflux RND transporter periplasmic adaptor subunit [Nocardioides sp. URHA0020]|uniref:efflux RND transporter periplasmic adaptor subunit n=1 Tax=Nocardioides sp. URHA0020 TaxID=1380392 RepID=UPI000ABC6651|nr:biotin/lipoyl-binding protein [Nocardioides sp. URHA0020]